MTLSGATQQLGKSGQGLVGGTRRTTVMWRSPQSTGSSTQPGPRQELSTKAPVCSEVSGAPESSHALVGKERRVVQCLVKVRKTLDSEGGSQEKVQGGAARV